MRVVGILCVVVVTKLLVTSDASSTPADYSTHSLISVDTPDAVRALRVGDESDIQEERTLPSVDSVLRYIPETAAHDAAKVARIETKLTLHQFLESQRIDNFESLRTIGSKWTKFAWLLSKNAEPKHLRLLLEEHKMNEDQIKSIIVPYTTLYESLGLLKSMKGIGLSAAQEAVKPFKAEEKVLTAMGMSVDKVDELLNKLLEQKSKWAQLEVMLINGIVPDDIGMMLRKNKKSKDEINMIQDAYIRVFNEYNAAKAKDPTGDISSEVFREMITAANKRDKTIHAFNDFLGYFKGVKNFMQNEKARLDLLNRLVERDIESVRIRHSLESNGIRKPKLNQIVSVYEKLLKDYKSTRNSSV